MVSVPEASALPLRLNIAVALLPDATTATVPKFFVPCVKVTLPVGEVVPVAGFTVATRVVLVVLVRLVGLAVRVRVVLMLAGSEVHCVTRLLASTEPKPVV